MTKTEKRAMRKAIAQEVLDQFDKTYQFKSCYFKVNNQTSIDFEKLSKKELQRTLKDIKQCDVCVVGAIIVAGIRLYGKVPGEFFDPIRSENSWAGQRFFSARQLGLLEDLFENNPSEYFDDKVRALLEHLPLKKRAKIIFKSIRDKDGKVSLKDIASRLEAQ